MTLDTNRPPPRRGAYLTMEHTDGWAIDVDLCIEPLHDLGWEVEAVPWRAETAPDWNRFDAVYIGVPWDYPEDPARFLDLLETIDNSDAILVNDLSLVRWSLAKTYLSDLQAGGADIVPSLWLDVFDPDAVADAFDRWNTDMVIVKPVIGTNATDTCRIAREQWPDRIAELLATFGDRPVIVQPFITGIRDEGEYSMFYFDRVFSHAIRKVPQPGDFRVQEERGAEILAIDPDAALLGTADRVMALVEPKPVYARGDFIRGNDGRFLVMELELIEPSMYLRMDADAPGRFARAFDSYVRKTAGDVP